MFRSSQLVCLLCIFVNLSAAAQPGWSHASRNTSGVSPMRLRAPRLVWQASLAGRETVRIAGAGSGKIAVLAEPRPRIENGVYVPHSIQLAAFDVKTGAPAWRKEILGGDLRTVADDSRLYMSLQGPQVSYDTFDFHEDTVWFQIVTFRWSDGRMGWQVFSRDTRNMLVWKGQLLYDIRSDNYLHTWLIAVNAATGEQQWARSEVPDDTETGKTHWKMTRNEINGLFAARDVLYAYDDTRDPDGEYLSAIDPATGKTTRSTLLYPLYRPTTHLSALTWIPQAQVLVSAIEQNTTPGINLYQMRALDSAGKPVWEHADVGQFQVVSNALVCRTYSAQSGEFPNGFVGLDPATGHQLWRQAAAIEADGYGDLNLGEWHGQAVVLLDRQLCGLNPRTGKMLWALTVLPSRKTPVRKEARIVGDVIIIALGGTRERPAQVRAYALRSGQTVSHTRR